MTKNSLQDPLRLPSICRREIELAIIAVAGCFFLASCSTSDSQGTVANNSGGMTNVAMSATKTVTLSDADVVELSSKSCAELDGKSSIASPKNKYAKRLAKIVKNMPSAVNKTPISYKVYITKDVNAWAMDNGCVRIYSGLMDLMNDDEVRGVIGHEIGHVTLGHSKKSMQTAYAASALRDAAGSSGNAAVASMSNSQLGELTEKLINSQFSQSQENAADDYSFDLLTERKLKREGLVSAFEKLAKVGGDNRSMLSSHPSSSDRAQHIRDRIAAKK
jgi:metalloprotease